MRRRFALVGTVSLALGLAGYACGGGGTGGSGATGTSTGSSSHTSSGGGTGQGNGGSGAGILTSHGKVVSLAISPPSATIDVTNGTSTPAVFSAIATYEDKTTGAVDATWSFDRPALAIVGQDGSLAANGNLGGKGTVTATVDTLTASAPVTVSLHITQNPAGLDPTTIALFDAPDASPSGTMLYPYDKTVFARGLLAPELMWSGGGAGDFYMVHLSEANFDARIYVSADPPSRAALPQDVWTELTQTNSGDDVQVDVLRVSGGAAHQAMHTTWTIAQGSLRGSIYYWAVNTGQLMKIAPGASSPAVVFDSGSYTDLGTPAPAGYDGYNPPWSQGVNDKRCVACHTVSKDGSTIVGVFERKQSAPSPWGTIDLTASPPSVVQMSPYAQQTLYLGLTPEGRYAVHNDIDFTLRLADAKSGAAISSALDGYTACADPAFSPDGTQLAFSSNVAGYYPVEFYKADLDVADFDPTALAFSNRRTIANGNGLAIAFPSYSPDSKWVLYQKGDYSRAKYGAAGTTTGHDELYITDVAGAVGEIKLAAASGADLDPRNQQRSYQPTVNPISVGGYTWVVFVSPRDYGNRMLSTSDATVENRKQLWVAAVDNDPQPGKDPSHPAFWLPGQALDTVNMSGYWALEACHQTGTSCNEGFECCTGFCQADGSGNLACVEPPGGCSKIGDKCGSDGDCCNVSAKCVGGFCAQGQPS